MAFDFHSVPLEQRCFQTKSGTCSYPVSDCFFGVPASDFFGFHPLESIPLDSTGFHFYLGPKQLELFGSFLKSDYPDSTTSLHLGYSSFYRDPVGDFSPLTELLMQTKFPKLETLKLGVFELFQNSCEEYGVVGSVDLIANVAPNLKRLHIYGKCSLSRPLELPNLEHLWVVVDSQLTNDGETLDQPTVHNFLASSLPSLKDLYVNLASSDDVSYEVPTVLFAGNALPNLTTFELTGTFRHGTGDRLSDSPCLQKSITLHVNDLVELPPGE